MTRACIPESAARKSARAVNCSLPARSPAHAERGAVIMRPQLLRGVMTRLYIPTGELKTRAGGERFLYGNYATATSERERWGDFIEALVSALLFNNRAR